MFFCIKTLIKLLPLGVSLQLKLQYNWKINQAERNPTSLVALCESNYLHSVKVTKKMSLLLRKRREFDVINTVHYS